MSKKSEYLRALVQERLSAAAEEIFALFERTIAEYEEELYRFKEKENRRKLQDPQVELQKHEKRGKHAQTDVPPHTLLDQENTDFSDGSETVAAKPEQDLVSVKSECDDCERTENGEDWAPAAGPSAWLLEGTDRGDTVGGAEGDGAEGDGAEGDGAEGDGAEGDGAEGHQCCICDEAFAEPRSLKRHMDVHMEEVEHFGRSGRDEDRRGAPQPRPQTHRAAAAPFGCSSFSCPFCKRGFARKSDLQYHILIHTGEKPFSCSQCNRRFNRKSNLYRHYRNHAKNKIL